MRMVGISAVTSTALIWCLAAPAVDSTRHSHALLEVIRDLPDSTQVGAYRCLESSWVLYGRHQIQELDLGAGSSKNASGSIDAQRSRLSPEQLIEKSSECVFLTLDRHSEELLKRLPDGYGVTKSAPYFLQRKTLVLISRATKASNPAASVSTRSQRGYF
jgi:hypothetical protein